jgi:hypothetical protein
MTTSTGYVGRRARTVWIHEGGAAARCCSGDCGGAVEAGSWYSGSFAASSTVCAFGGFISPLLAVRSAFGFVCAMRVSRCRLTFGIATCRQGLSSTSNSVPHEPAIILRLAHVCDSGRPVRPFLLHMLGNGKWSLGHGLSQPDLRRNALCQEQWGGLFGVPSAARSTNCCHCSWWCGSSRRCTCATPPARQSPPACFSPRPRAGGSTSHSRGRWSPIWSSSSRCLTAGCARCWPICSAPHTASAVYFFRMTER